MKLKLFLYVCLLVNVVADALPLLTIDELQALTAEQKQKSDTIILDAFIAIAQECFFKSNKNNIVGKKQFKGNDAFGAYKALILLKLTNVGNNNDFKLRKQLEIVLNDEHVDGSILHFITQKLIRGTQTEESFLNSSKQALADPNNSQLVAKFYSLCSPLFFDKQLLETIKNSLVTIIINIFVSQREQIKDSDLVNKPKQVISDGLVENALEAILAPVHTEVLDIQNAWEGITNAFKDFVKQQTEFNKIKGWDKDSWDHVKELRKDAIAHSSEKNQEQKLMETLDTEIALVRKKMEDTVTALKGTYGAIDLSTYQDEALYRILMNPLDTSLVTLHAHYLSTLYQGIDMLRLEPEFLLFNLLLGKEAQSILNKKIKEKAFAIPALNWLAERVASSMTLQIFKGIAHSQLFLNVKNLEEFFKNHTNDLKAIFSGIRHNLIASKGILMPGDINVILEQRITPAKIKRIIDIESALLSVRNSLTSTQKSELALVEKIITELKNPNPNSDKIIQDLKKLTGTKVLSYEKIIRNIIMAYNAQQQIQHEAIKILVAARQEYIKRGGKPDNTIKIGIWLTEKLKAFQKKFGNKLTQDQKKYFNNLTKVDRIPEDVFTIFKQLIGAQDIVKYAKLEDFDTWIEPYGLLVMVLKNWKQESVKGSSSDRFLKLSNSFHALNGEKIKSPYLSVIADQQALIQSGAYKKRMQPILDALKARAPQKIVGEVTQFIQQAKTGAQTQAQYKRITQEFISYFAHVYLQEIIEQLQALSKGTGSIAGLPLKGEMQLQHAQLYKRLKTREAFTPLLDVINPKGQPVDIRTLNDTVLTSAIEAVKKRIDSALINLSFSKDISVKMRKSLATYLDTIKEKLLFIQQAIEMATGTTA